MNLPVGSFMSKLQSERRFHCSNEVFIGVKIILVAVCISRNFIDVKFVAEHTTDTSETLAKLETIWWFVSDKFNQNTVPFVVDAKPVRKLLVADHFKVDARLLILEVFGIFLLNWIQNINFCFVGDWVFDFIAHNFNIFKEKHSFEGA